MEETVTWISKPNSPETNFPKWLRSVALTGDGCVFVPAYLAGSERPVFLAALFDGQSALMKCGHIYVPAVWLASQFPDTRELCEKIRHGVIASLED